MPVEARSPDVFTRDFLLLGFSKIEFRPRVAGVLGGVVDLGILSAQEMAKEVNLLTLPDGSAGTVSVAREALSSLEPSFNLASFNFSPDVAKFIFGAPSTTDVSAEAAAAATDEVIVIPTGSDAARSFVPLANGDVDDTDANLTLACQAITEVIAGDGTGDTDGDYTLSFKPLVLADVNNGTTLEFTQNTSLTGALVRTYTVQVGEPAGATEAQLAVGTGATSGQLDLFQTVPVGDELRITYTPSHNLVEDFDAADPDMLLDPLLGRIRFPNLDSFASPDATSALRQGQTVLLAYLWNRKAHVTMKPFTQGGGVFEGTATIKHLPDIGINFIWTIPNASIRIDDNALTFGSDDFAVGSIVLNILDAGGTDRYGTIQLSSEVESAA